MSSRSPSARPGAPLVTALLVALVAVGCAREETHVTPLQFVPIDRDYPCIGPGPVNVILVEVMRYEGQPEASRAIAAQCRGCTEISCPVIARECLCVGERATVDALVDALGGLRFELPADDKLCVRVVGMHTGTAAGPAAGPGEACEAAVCAGEIPDKSVKICGLSDVGALSEAGSPLIIRDYACATAAAIGSLDCETIERLCAVRPELELCAVPCDGAPLQQLFDMTPMQCATLGR